MGDCVLVMEEGVPKMDSVASGTGSLVQINSIEIDLRSSMEPPKLEGFSIRGFVADMRKKNRKACLPFGDADDKLPPMSVPSFRRWQCPDTDAQRGSKGKMASTDSLQDAGDEDCIILHSTELNRELGNDSVPPKLRSIADIMGIERNPQPELDAERKRKTTDLGEDGGLSRAAKRIDGGKAAALDLNTTIARHTGIPDLNEEPPEENHLALPHTWDRNGTTSEAKRPFTISESENNEASDDDIPMEIVELLANNMCVDGRPSPSITGYPHNVAVHSSFKVGPSHHPNKQSSQVRQSAGSKKASCSNYSAQLVQEVASHSEKIGVCTLNRNPADFSIPDARNDFTISAKDLKFRKRTNILEC